MPRGSIPWSEEEKNKILAMRKSGYTMKEIAERIDRTFFAVRAQIDRMALTPEDRRLRDKRNKERFPRVQRPHIEGPSPELIARLRAERDRRWSSSPRDLTALCMGDPLPGCSALDR